MRRTSSRICQDWQITHGWVARDECWHADCAAAWMSWLESLNPTVRILVAGILAWCGWLALAASLRTIRALHEIGWRQWCREAFTIEPETWRLIAVLVLVALACVFACSIGTPGLRW